MKRIITDVLGGIGTGLLGYHFSDRYVLDYYILEGDKMVIKHLDNKYLTTREINSILANLMKQLMSNSTGQALRSIHIDELGGPSTGLMTDPRSWIMQAILGLSVDDSLAAENVGIFESIVDIVAGFSDIALQHKIYAWLYQVINVIFERLEQGQDVSAEFLQEYEWIDHTVTFLRDAISYFPIAKVVLESILQTVKNNYRMIWSLLHVSHPVINFLKDTDRSIIKIGETLFTDLQEDLFVYHNGTEFRIGSSSFAIPSWQASKDINSDHVLLELSDYVTERNFSISGVRDFKKWVDSLPPQRQ